MLRHFNKKYLVILLLLRRALCTASDRWCTWSRSNSYADHEI